MDLVILEEGEFVRFVQNSHKNIFKHLNQFFQINPFKLFGRAFSISNKEFLFIHLSGHCQNNNPALILVRRRVKHKAAAHYQNLLHHHCSLFLIKNNRIVNRLLFFVS